MKANEIDIAELNGMYEVDGSHSSVGFAIRHIVTTTNGSILIDSGFVNLQNTTGAKMFFQIDVNTINTQSEKRDEHLKAGDFFDVAKYPKMTFEATDVMKDTMAMGDFAYVAKGKLTIKGITKEIFVPFNYMGKSEMTESFLDKDGKEVTLYSAVVGFEGKLKISRKDFKIGEEGAGLGDEVTINFTIEAMQAVK
jgi:polyisoprenoid-binding protein YceI